MKKIGFIGTGVMGEAMIDNLIKSNYNVSFYARNKEIIKKLNDKGISNYTNIKDLAQNSDIIITIIGTPNDVKDVYFSDDGLIKNANKNSILIDMTTSSPKLAKEIYTESLNYNIKVLDAPVTGGDIGAKNATLTIFVGGEQSIFDEVYDIFAALGKNIKLIGLNGSGQHAKLANQIAIAGSISGMCESLTYAKKQNLNLDILLPMLVTGSAGSWQLQNMAPRAINNDFKPGFFIKHFIKDLKLANEEMLEKDINLKMINTVIDMYSNLAKLGFEYEGTQLLFNYYNLVK